ncbi:MAG: AAA family ATPase, partial [SAR324 cluster bacterium]|nr:AAA family ATPase [SAR324 cluster bacterium]
YEFCSQIRKLPEGRHIPLLMLTSLDSVEQKIKGFETGADDYIVKPFEPREFLARVAILIKRSDVAKQILDAEKISGKTIAVFSLRGGAGVSTVAANISVGLSQIWGYPTTLVDMVMTGGQSALYLNQSLKNTWAEISKFPSEEIDDYMIQSALLPHESGVRTLASPRRPDLAELVTDEKVNSVLSILKEINEYVVLDLPHDFSPTTLAALDRADLILVVLQPEIVSIRAAIMAMETFTTLKYDLNHVYIILNWTFPRKGISMTEIEKSLDKKISLVIPYAADELIHGLNYGIPPTYAAPEKPIGVLFEDLAMSVSKESHRKQKPTDPSEAWTRVAKRIKERRKQKS